MKISKLTPEAVALRTRAEIRLKQQQAQPVTDAGRSLADTQRLLHELQVHQVELEMQNAELVESRDEMELLLDKYTDLYDFAPIGFFSLNRHGRVLEVNLTGSALLGAERSSLINRPLSWFVDLSTRHLFLEFLQTVFAASGKTVCEVKLLKSNGTTFWASLHGGSKVALSSTSDAFRIAVSDITSLKLAQEAHQRLEILTATNLELKNEIIKREAIEESLRKSEENKTQLLDKAQRLQEQLRGFSHRIIETREEERRLISRQLHDEITQLLVGINVSLETLSRDPSVKSSTLKEKIVHTQSIVETSVKVIHEFAHKLRPTSLDDLGLIVTLHSYLNEYLRKTGIRVHFKAFSDVEKMSNTQRTIIYRMVLEALINVDKHAKARQVEVSIQKIDDLVQLEISDDGEGFDALQIQALKDTKHLGLIGIREQAEMIGGELTIQSTPGQGTKLLIRMPFKDVAEEYKSK